MNNEEKEQYLKILKNRVEMAEKNLEVNRKIWIKHALNSPYSPKRVLFMEKIKQYIKGILK